MAIEQDGRFFTKCIHHENGKATTRRIHEMVVQAVDGRTYRIRGAGLPDSISLFCGELDAGKHFAEVLCDPRIPKPRWFGFFQKPTIRDYFYLWIGASGVIVVLLALTMSAAFHR